MEEVTGSTVEDVMDLVVASVAGLAQGSPALFFDRIAKSGILHCLCSYFRLTLTVLVFVQSVVCSELGFAVRYCSSPIA